MRTTLVWADVIPPSEGSSTPSTVWDIAFRSDGSIMVVAAGRYLIVYNSADGTKLKTRVGASLHAAALPTRTPFQRCRLVAPPSPPPSHHFLPTPPTPSLPAQRTRRTFLR